MRSGSNYIVLKSSNRVKQTVTKSGLIEEKPKVSIRRGLMKLGILQFLVFYWVLYTKYVSLFYQ